MLRWIKNLKSDTVTADTVNTNSVTVGAPGKDGVITVKMLMEKMEYLSMEKMVLLDLTEKMDHQQQFLQFKVTQE